eukprot:7384666-Prymnesium_polylepis.1
MSNKVSMQDTDDEDETKEQGTYTFSKGATYKGELLNGKPDGQGECTYSNGTFVGQWWKGWRVRGKYTFTSGGVYEGEFRNDKRHGRGMYDFANGEAYVGEFENGNYT